VEIEDRRLSSSARSWLKRPGRKLGGCYKQVENHIRSLSKLVRDQQSGGFSQLGCGLISSSRLPEEPIRAMLDECLLNDEEMDTYKKRQAEGWLWLHDSL